MAVRKIDVNMLVKMFLAGAQNIEAKKEYINELNVFPVPDGDTGTNMSLTIMMAAKEVKEMERVDMAGVAKVISSGTLRGARGNSGVILSQLLRGFTKVISDRKYIDCHVLALACRKASETAYKAVMKPKEGTILTVARGIAEKATEMAQETEDMEVFFPEVIAHAQTVLEGTPELLPVLKEAGVVDSGGQGLLEILRGAYDAFLGKEVVFSKAEETPSAGRERLFSEGEEIKFGYCTEFLIMLEKEFNEKDENHFKKYLESIGDSLVCVADEDIVKVHVHTNDPGLAIQKGLTYGQLSRLKIDNMREEHNEKLIRDAQKKSEREKMTEVAKPAKKKDTGFVVVSAGEGLNSVFTELGADFIITGGQTMNPSTEDMLNAISEVNAETVFVFPNNKNIILAAEQAKKLMKDKAVIVIPTTTIPQGITAMIGYESGMDPAANAEKMNEEVKNVKSGQVTYAVRDTSIDDVKISQGDIMGIGDQGILAVDKDISKTVKQLVEALVDEEDELISLYYGEEVDEEDARLLSRELELLYPDMDVDVQYGGQPIYYYLLSVE